MQIGEKGLDLIKGFESLRLKCYRDPIGLPTVGWGHLVKRGEQYPVGSVITLAEANRLLKLDLADAERDVAQNLRVAVNQDQYDALVSLAFNLGSLKVTKTLLSKLNHNDFSGAAAAFGLYVYAAGKKLNGLIRRRAAEKALFTGK